ncbi:hypothetical protein [Acidocella aminolytica]|nr:hypothetical protein [Acidocella aminolytica]
MPARRAGLREARGEALPPWAALPASRRRFGEARGTLAFPYCRVCGE